MQRVRIEVPGECLFELKKTIAASDINGAGHLGNDRILVWADEVRHQFFSTLWLGDRDLETNSGFIVANHSIQYKAEGFEGDHLSLQVFVDNISDCSFDFYIRVKNTDKDIDMILMRTGIVFFDYSKRIPTDMPLSLREVLSPKVLG